MINSLIPYDERLISPYFLGGYPNEPIIQPESPETAIAREDQEEASELLKIISKDHLSEKALEVSSTISHDYLTNISQRKIDESEGVKVSFKRKRNLISMLSGNDEGFELDITLKK